MRRVTIAFASVLVLMLGITASPHRQERRIATVPTSRRKQRPRPISRQVGEAQAITTTTSMRIMTASRAKISVVAAVGVEPAPVAAVGPRTSRRRALGQPRP